MRYVFQCTNFSPSFLFTIFTQISSPQFVPFPICRFPFSCARIPFLAPTPYGVHTFSSLCLYDIMKMVLCIDEHSHFPHMYLYCIKLLGVERWEHQNSANKAFTYSFDSLRDLWTCDPVVVYLFSFFCIDSSLPFRYYYK